MSNNVKENGIKGDGTTDDTKAIQNLIDNSIGTILFPAGNYLITKGLIINKNNITLKGEGKNTASQLICADNFDAITVNGMRCVIDGVAVDGNRKCKNGITVNGTQSELMNCFIQNCLENGIYLSWNASSPINQNVSGCKIFTCIGSGIVSTTTDLYIKDCEIANNEGDAQIILAGANNRLFNTHVWSGDQYTINPKTVGIEIRASGVQVQGCVLDRNNSFGISVNPNDQQSVTSVIIIGNWFFENGNYIHYKKNVSGIIEIGNSYN